MGVQVTGGDELAATLAQHAARVRDPAAFLAGEAETLEELLQASWQTEQSPDGEAWSPRVLASRDARTGRARARRDSRAGRLLDRTGLLRASEFVRVMGQSLIVENGAPYAAFLQRGTRWMRARKVVPTAEGGGPVGDWLHGLARRLERFVTTGRA